MMDTVLNLGLNEQTLHGLVALTGNERFGWDAYRRFIQMFGRIVMDVDGEKFEHALDAAKQRRGVTQDTDLDAGALRELVGEFQPIVRESAGREFPSDPLEQLDLAIKAVFASWFGKRARDYREYNKIAHDLGTAVNVVTMVFGNMGDDSGTGVAFTRDPNTGEKVLFGEYLTNAQGEDVVAGIRTPTADLRRCATSCPRSTPSSSDIAQRLEQHYQDVQDLEFTIERGQLYMLQTRSAQADGGGGRAHRGGHGRRGHHHRARGARPDRAGARRPAAARPVRPVRQVTARSASRPASTPRPARRWARPCSTPIARSRWPARARR